MTSHRFKRKPQILLRFFFVLEITDEVPVPKALTHYVIFIVLVFAVLYNGKVEG